MRRQYAMASQQTAGHIDTLLRSADSVRTSALELNEQWGPLVGSTRVSLWNSRAEVRTGIPLAPAWVRGTNMTLHPGEPDK